MRTGSIVTQVDDEGVKVGEERIAAQTVLWAAGVAASPIAASLGVPLDRAGRVQAQPTLQVPGHPEIFVAGTCARCSRTVPGCLAWRKSRSRGGAHAAKNVIRLVTNQPPVPFHYADYGNMATIGRGSAVADVGPLRASGLFAWLIWLLIHIFWLIGFRSRIAVMSEWAWFYFTLQRRVRLIIGEKLWPGSPAT